MRLKSRDKNPSYGGYLFIGLIYLASLALISCELPSSSKRDVSEQSRPNILWLVIEDTSPILPPYGDDTIKAPNISRLAKEGVTYTNVYSPSGVCSPSRASLALGMYPSGIGANHMRTSSHTEVTGLPAYEAVPPPEARMLSQYMRGLGYYTTNNYKTDYQFKSPKNAWDESGIFAHWRNRPKDKPFFLRAKRRFISLKIQISQSRLTFLTRQRFAEIFGKCIIISLRQIGK